MYVPHVRWLRGTYVPPYRYCVKRGRRRRRTVIKDWKSRLLCSATNQRKLSGGKKVDEQNVRRKEEGKGVGAKLALVRRFHSLIPS